MDPAAIERHLKLVQNQYEVYRRFVVAGPDGRTVYDSAAGAHDAPAADAWYSQAMEGKRYFSPVRLDAESGQSVFQLAAPICDGDGQPRGAVCATVNTAGILRWVLNISLGKTGECYLVDKTGMFLAHQDPQRILRDNIAQSGSFANIFHHDPSQSIYRDYRDIAVLGASRDIPGTEWYVVVEQDQDEAFAPSYRLRATIRVAMVLTFLGAVGLSLWLGFYLAAPIRMLSEAAHALAGGDFQNPLIHASNTRHDELGRLHRAFEDMANQLHDRHRKLETQVGRSQVELQQAGIRLENTIEAAARSEHLAVLGRLASGVAHEIRTPLASLKLYLQSVQEDLSISPELGEDFDVAMRQVDRIEGTINHFLSFARPREPVFAILDIYRLVDDAIMVVRPRANHQKVAVVVSFGEDLPEIRGDMRQLVDALVNLFVNALDEMPNGGNLTVSVARDAIDGGAWARIDVADNGPGIRQEDLESLFEPFFTTKASGSGLGLTIVQGTVQRHGGLLRVGSTLGAGTTFTILLPATRES
jgi:signal transduction histidine kinase